MQFTTCGRGVHIREVVGIERLRRLPNEWYGFTNLDLATGRGRSREIDLVLVSEDRIFLIDLKDWHGRIESEGGRWLHNGVDTGPSPVAKIHHNAKAVGYLLSDHIKRHMKGEVVPRVVGLVVVTGKADLRGIVETEQGSVFYDEDFIAAVSKVGSRINTFGPVAPTSRGKLTESVWKDQLSKFFNARNGPIVPGQRRYGNFIAASDDASFEHPQEIYKEYDACDENVAQTMGTLRIWDFSKAETRFQNEEARQEIAGRERSVVEFLKDRGEACENAILQPRAEDPERGVAYWEVYDRRQRLRRLSEFVTAEATDLPRESRIELARQLLSRVAVLHGAEAAHLDLGGHSIWVESPSTVKLSHLMAAHYPQVETLGDRRYQFLSTTKLPEDVLGGENIPKRKDVFLTAAAVHWLLFGVQPKADPGDDMPVEWDPDVDNEAKYSDLHSWFERALALSPEDRFPDAISLLDAFNAATSNQPSASQVLAGLERFRTEIRSQRQFFSAYPEIESLKESDTLDIWKTHHEGKPALVKLWKSAAWGEQSREGPRILDFLTRSRDVSLSPIPGCANVIGCYWLADALAIVQSWVEGQDLATALQTGHFDQKQTEPLNFALALANTVVALHDDGLAHGDIKPQNIIVRQDDQLPVLIDLLDFRPSADGEVKSSAYSPERGGRLERDRFGVTKITEEILARSALPDSVSADITAAIRHCRENVPENGTLLPLVEALERSLEPPKEQSDQTRLQLGVVGAALGPLLPDEGAYYIRKGENGRQNITIRGACEELVVYFDNDGRPVSGRRIPIDQKRIGRISRFEFMHFEAAIEISSSAINDFQGLSALLEHPDFIAEWSNTRVGVADTSSQEETTDPQPEPAFQDAAFDSISEKSQEQHKTEDAIDLRQLWRALIDAEGELTTDGIALGDSGYNRDLKRHMVPFELSSGTFDFNRNDQVGVERLGRKGAWQRIGVLDIARSKPDRIFIDASEMSSSSNSSLVTEDQQLRFTSHYQVQSLKRRESAISRILSGQAKVPEIYAPFEPGTNARPTYLEVPVSEEDLAPYGFNEDQKEAFKKLLQVRPIGALQGPPGTGKTHFIAALAHFALTRGLANNVLLASQSHEAVNNAAEAVLRLFAHQGEQPSILRVGNEGVVSQRLMPFHTGRIEQFYKDRFTAEMRERLRIIGRALGIASSVVEGMIDIETGMRPVAVRLNELRKAHDPDSARVNSLVDTLTALAARLAPSYSTLSEVEDPLELIQLVTADLVKQAPSGQRPSPESLRKLRSVFQLSKDFVGSVSTQQRGFEAFLAGTRQMVVGTCVGLGRTSLGLTATPFDLVIVDEAARCTSSDLAVPMQAGRWVVLVGDHAQLEPQHPATVVSTVAAQIKTDELTVIRSDFERLFANGYGALAGAKLKTQYRMLPPIGKVVSEAFYDGQLTAGRDTPEVDPHILPDGLERPITWITTDALAAHGEDRTEGSGTSRVNPAEADAIVSLLKGWTNDKAFTDFICDQTKHAHVIGVICMYAAQADLLRKKIQAANLPEAFRRTIKIGTVDSYQGKENPIVILSLVRNNVDGPTEGGISTIRPGFLIRPNRINVAVSRAMDRLIIVGAKSRWQTGTPMYKLSEAVERRYQAGEATVTTTSHLLNDAHVKVRLHDEVEA